MILNTLGTLFLSNRDYTVNKFIPDVIINMNIKMINRLTVIVVYRYFFLFFYKILLRNKDLLSVLDKENVMS